MSESNKQDVNLEIPAVERLPRNLQSSPNFRPDWRWRQADLYFQHERVCREKLHIVFPYLPKDETDALIAALLLVRVKNERRFQALNYALEMHLGNPTTLAANRVKAMTIAGAKTFEIAQELGTFPINIAAFQDVFFDVKDYLGNETAIASLMQPANDRSLQPWEERELVLMRAAWELKWPEFKFFMNGRWREAGKSNDDIKKALPHLAFQAALEIQAGVGDPNARAIERWIKAQEKTPLVQTAYTGPPLDAEFIEIIREASAKMFAGMNPLNTNGPAGKIQAPEDKIDWGAVLNLTAEEWAFLRKTPLPVANGEEAEGGGVSSGELAEIDEWLLENQEEMLAFFRS